MATVKYDTPFGTQTTQTNDSAKHRRTMEPWEYNATYDKKGWLREAAFEKGLYEKVSIDQYNGAALVECDGVYTVDGYACGRLYTGKWRSLNAARDFFVGVLNKMYVE